LPKRLPPLKNIEDTDKQEVVWATGWHQGSASHSFPNDVARQTTSEIPLHRYYPASSPFSWVWS
jgi:hypothetical protein